MKTIYSFNLTILLLIGFFVLGVLGLCKGEVADSLDQLLSTQEREYQEASPETKQLWENTLSSVERNEYDKAPALLQQFLDIKNVVEPYQTTFCAITLKLLTTSSEASKPIDTAAANQDEINKTKLEISSLKKAISTEENKRPDLLFKEQAQSRSHLDDAFGAGASLDDAGRTDAINQLAEIDHKIQLYNKNISDLEVHLNQLQTVFSHDQINQSNEETAFHNEVSTFLNTQKDDNHYRLVIALANVWNAKRGQDPDINKIAQDCIDLQKIEAKAIQIAQAALKPAIDLIAAGKIWSAETEIDRAEDLIKSHITDPQQMEFIERELFSTKNDVKRQIDTATKKRDTVLDVAQRDAIEGYKQFDAFVKQYPDYPDQDQDRLKINDFKTQQVEAKYAQKIQAIEEVIPDDPEEAKKMIERLLGSGLSDDEVSILKSKVVKLKRQILDQEIELVTNNLDEAQSYLTRVSATYAADLKRGGKPDLSFIESVSSGTENLVRARSLQAGGIKRLEMLLNEDTDNVTKSRLVGLLETQKVALEQMDGTIATQERDKMIAMVGIGVLVCAVLGIIIFVIMIFRRKKT